jgi:lysophospholipase L1-like esterase
VLIGDSLAEGLAPELARLAVGPPMVAFHSDAVKGSTIRQWLGGTAVRDAVREGDTNAIVILGTNDMAMDPKVADPATEGSRAEKLIRGLRQQGVAAVAWVAPPAMAFDKPAFREALAASCEAEAARLFDTPATGIDLERAPDKIHLTPAGYRAWAEAIAAWLPLRGLPPAAKPEKAATVPDTIVVEGMGRMPLEEYVARVVTGENGRAREPHALAALAMAARTYAVYLMRHGGWGTDAKPMLNSTRQQVVAPVQIPRAVAATSATRGGLILYRHKPILACHNAGAIWRPGALTGEDGKDDTRTEKNITYNRSLTGRDVRPTPIAQASVEGNRGCLSQNGSVALAARGMTWPEILRYFYGDDVEFTIPEPAGRRREEPGRPPEGGDGAAIVLALGGLYAAYRLTRGGGP